MTYVKSSDLEFEIAKNHSAQNLNQLAQRVWRDWSLNKLTDLEAQSLAESLERKRHPSANSAGSSLPNGGAPSRKEKTRSYFPAKKPSQSRRSLKDSLLRRRKLAASGPLPPHLAARFSTGELAALRIVADEMRDRRQCALTLGEISARAGVGVTTARNAIKHAAELGLLTIEERRQYKKPNLPNLLRIAAREWLTWISRNSKKIAKVFDCEIIGSKKIQTTDNLIKIGNIKTKRRLFSKEINKNYYFKDKFYD